MTDGMPSEEPPLGVTPSVGTIGGFDFETESIRSFDDSEENE